MNLDKWRNKPNANTSDGDLVNKDEETLQLSTQVQELMSQMRMRNETNQNTGHNTAPPPPPPPGIPFKNLSDISSGCIFL